MPLITAEHITELIAVESRVPLRRTDASTYLTEDPFSAQPQHVIGMLQALASFVEYLCRWERE